jgi:mannose-6-phosphate isomerase-like protein (cupin superfamily)
MKKKGIFLLPGAGRPYAMGRIGSVFLADGAETDDTFSLSEWWLEPNTKGPGAHDQEEDSFFYVIEGTMTILLDDRWLEAPRGSFVFAPAGMTHDFENRSESRAGILAFSMPGGFEKEMPAIVNWFAEHPAASVR